MKSLLLIPLLAFGTAYGQFSDSFSDGNYTENPIWYDSLRCFEVNAEGTLHLDSPDSVSKAIISTRCAVARNAEWLFSVKMGFNPSSSNFCRVYLMCDSPDKPDSLSGYFVLLGGTADEISLYRQTGKALTKLIDGPDKWLNNPLVNLRVAVSLNDSGNWNLTADTNLSGNYVSIGQVHEPVLINPAYFSIYTQFTATRADKFWFDDVEVRGQKENIQPRVTGFQTFGLDSVELTFDEALEIASAQNPENYLLADEHPKLARLDNDREITLVFDYQENGTKQTLHISGVTDISLNHVSDTLLVIPFCESIVPFPNDLIITEIMVDPSPPVALPEFEYIELFNRSDHFLSLNSLQINQVVLPSNVCVPPSGYFILTDEQALNTFNSEIRVVPCHLGTYFLNNNGDEIILTNVENIPLCSLAYHSDWFEKDPLKANGGYSFERMNVSASTSPDVGEWQFSSSPSGGTPGKENSIVVETREESEILFSSELITPNSDGHNDVLTLSFLTHFSGTLSLTVYSSNGILLKTICHQEPIGKSASYTWAADLDSGNPAPVGIYIVYAELFDGEMVRKKVKKTVTVSR